MDITQIMGFGLIGILLVVWGFVGDWKSCFERIKGFRWDYRSASTRDLAQAPMIALVASIFMRVPEWVGEFLVAAWRFLKDGFLVILASFALLASSPVSFPALAFYQRREARKKMLEGKKRNLKEKAYA
ncbi:hypothetical protein FW800_25720 [Pseudomonas sp. 910_23]|uniref:hypothetical protein n=1 Tax=Pseudomonas sp. 910_23 TaxID=2604461 RepID=UPI004063E0C1